jgi:small GTP-binding protein
MNDDAILNCKVVLLGESGVGKTGIITRYVNNYFEDNSLTTNGASSTYKTIYLEKYNKSIKFEIWDTAGQERYRALTKIFYKNTNAVILCYDITKKGSFNEIKNYWFNEVKNNSPNDIVIAIAANKSDLYESEEVNEEEAINYAKSVGVIFFETSAMNSSGIDDLFNVIGDKFIDSKYCNEDKLKKNKFKLEDENKNDKIKKLKKFC